MWSGPPAHRHFQVLDFSTDPHRAYTFWAGLFGGIALTLATHGTDQFLVQRLLSARSLPAASTGLILSGVLVLAQFVLFLIIGAMLYTFYQHTALPRPLTRTDEILRFRCHLLPPVCPDSSSRRLYGRRVPSINSRGHHRNDST